MPDQTREIVSRMVAAGEPEENIALVIQHLSKAAPAPAASHAAAPPASTSPFDQFYDEAVRAGKVSESGRDMFRHATEGVMGGGVVTAAPTAIGAAVQEFAPGVSKMLKGGAERLYGGLLKAKDATIERFPTVVQDLIKARVPISQGGRAKVITGLQRIGAEKNALLAKADERAMVPRETFRRGLDDSLETAISHSDTPVKDVDKLAKIERDLLPDEPGVLPSRADKIKTKLQAESDRGFRAAKLGIKTGDTAARAKMAVSHEAKQALEAIEPKLKDVNAAYGSGKGQAEALRDALKRTDKHGIIGMSDLVGGGVGTAIGGPGGGAAGVALAKLLSHPTTGSHAALLMNDASKIPHLDQAMKAALLSMLAEQE